MRKADYCYTLFGISLRVRDYIGFKILEIKNAEAGIVNHYSCYSISFTR